MDVQGMQIQLLQPISSVNVGSAVFFYMDSEAMLNSVRIASFMSWDLEESVGSSILSSLPGDHFVFG